MRVSAARANPAFLKSKIYAWRLPTSSMKNPPNPGISRPRAADCSSPERNLPSCAPAPVVWSFGLEARGETGVLVSWQAARIISEVRVKTAFFVVIRVCRWKICVGGVEAVRSKG
jgi:hypothetical protein